MTAIEELKLKVFENFSDKEIDQNYNIPIWRFMSFDSLLEIMVEKKITLVKTNQWEDPYENFIYKSKFIINKAPLDLSKLSQNIYGQCWTMINESDAMWRIYSKDSRGVSIKSSVLKLFNSILVNPVLQENLSRYNKLSFKIGKVEYLTKEKIIPFLETHPLIRGIPDTLNPFLLKCLFIKREEFRHEHELRLILLIFDNLETINIPINPNEFIEEITFDPRISDRIFETFSKTLNHLGYKGKIKKSLLYDNDRLEIKL